MRKSSKYHLRNTDFHLPRFNSVRYGEHSIRYFGAYIWSRLDSKIKDKPTLQSFKSIQYNTIILFKEGSAITFYSFLTYGPQIPAYGVLTLWIL